MANSPGEPNGPLATRSRVSRAFLAWLVPALVGVFLLAGGLIAFLQYRSLDQDLLGKADRSARLAAVALAKPVWDLDMAQIDQSLEALVLDPEITAARVDSRDGNLAMAKNPLDIRPGLLVQRRAIVQPGHPGTVLGEVTLYLNRDLLLARVQESILALAAVLVLTLATAILLSDLIQRRLVTRPIEALVAGIARNSGASVFQPVPAPRDDEIGYLARSFNRLTRTLKEQARHLEEIELAREIQTVLLPREPALPGYDIAASLVPVAEVGGDYFDVISAGGRDWIVVGDVSGHGVTSGLVMMMAQTAIHTVLLSFPETPVADLLVIINRSLHRNIQRMKEKTHMTLLVLGCRQDGRFVFAGLHEDILLRRAGTGRVERIRSDGMWIGLEGEIAGLVPEQSLAMAPGDCMLLYTDGLTEARQPGGGFFGDDRLAELLAAAGGGPARAVRAKLLEALEDFECRDDVTILVITRTP